MSTAYAHLDLVSRIHAGERNFSGQLLHDAEFGAEPFHDLCDFRGADLRCAHLECVKIAPEVLAGADLRLAHLKRLSPLTRHLAELEAVGCRLLSRRAWGRELYALRDDDPLGLVAIAALVTAGEFDGAAARVRPGSVLATVIQAAAEPDPNPIRRDLVHETRRLGGLAELDEFLPPRDRRA